MYLSFPFTIFAKFSKNHVLSFSLSGLQYRRYSELFNFDNVKRIALNVSAIRILLSIESLNGKNSLSEGQPRFLSDFPFVNLQIKSIVDSLRSKRRALKK